MKNGGYAIISHDDINIFNKIDSAYKAGKPILFYDDDKTCFYVDSVKVNGNGDYEFTKGGKTWTVTDNNTLSSEGEIQPQKLYVYYFNADEADNINGDGTVIASKSRMSFICDIPNLATMAIKDIKGTITVSTLNATVTYSGNEVNILIFKISYDNDKNVLQISDYQDTNDNNNMVMEFETNPF